MYLPKISGSPLSIYFIIQICCIATSAHWYLLLFLGPLTHYLAITTCFSRGGLFPSGQIISSLDQNALSRLRKSVCWGIQEVRPDSTGSVSALQVSFGLSQRPSIPHLQALPLYHKMTVIHHLDRWHTNFVSFCLHWHNSGALDGRYRSFSSTE